MDFLPNLSILSLKYSTGNIAEMISTFFNLRKWLTVDKVVLFMLAC